MTPAEHLRKLSLLGEAGTLEEKNLYRLASRMTTGELHQQQEVLMRNPMMTVNPPLLGSGPQRIQSVPSQLEARFVERDSFPFADMMAPPDPRQIHITSHLGASVPPHVNMPHVLPNAVYPGYNFLQPESMEVVARRQELVQKQNLARMEMEMGTIFQQREIGKAQHKGLMGLGLETSFLYQHGIPTNPVAFRGRSRFPEVHLPNDLYVHRSSLDDLHGNTRLMTTGPYPPVCSWQKEKGRRLGKRVGNHKASGWNARSSKNQEEDRNPDQTLTVSAAEKEDKKDLDIDPHPKYEPSQSNGEPAMMPTKSLKEHEHSPQKTFEEHGWSIETNDNGGGNAKDSCHSSTTSDDKYIFHSPVSLPPLPYGFPVLNNSSFFLPGTGDLFLNGEDLSSVEDIRKWAVDDVYDFITGLPGCSDYAQIFRDHAIDGETLPLLTEEHLLDTMGLKLGPALKIRSQMILSVLRSLLTQNFHDSVICKDDTQLEKLNHLRFLNILTTNGKRRLKEDIETVLGCLHQHLREDGKQGGDSDSQVSRHLGSMVYMASLSLPLPFASTRKSSDPPTGTTSPLNCTNGAVLDVSCSQDMAITKTGKEIASEARNNPVVQTDLQIISFPKS